MRIEVEVRDSFAEAMRAHYGPIARAATAAMDRAADAMKREGRASIAGAGFSRRWQNTWRTRRYPQRGEQIDAAAFGWHRISYAAIFETGGTVAGSPMLWLPLPNAPRKLGRNRMTPGNFVAQVGPLFGFKSRRGTPLLGAPARVSRRQAQARRPKASLAALRRGAQGGGTGVLRTVPIFHGVSMVRIGKRFDLAGVQRGIFGRVPDWYYAALRDD